MKLDNELEFEQKTLKTYKKYFLNNLKSAQSTKFKRYLGSPLRYPGGKSLAVGMILEKIPENVERVISPFFGGGSVEIACANELKIPVIGFDIFNILVNYWQVQINAPIKIANKLNEFEPTNEGFKQVKNILKLHWENKEIIKNKIDLAAYYYFNHNTSYGPGFLSWPSSVYMQIERYKKMIEKVKKTKLENIEVSCDSFENIFPTYQHDFFYCDPPYFLDGDSKMFKGIYPQRNFPIHHNNFNHKLLRDLLLNHQGKFIVSYNDCSTIREWYKDFEIIEVSWQYTMGQGETRIGFNRNIEGISHIKKSHEILIIKK